VKPHQAFGESIRDMVSAILQSDLALLVLLQTFGQSMDFSFLVPQFRITSFETFFSCLSTFSLDGYVISLTGYKTTLFCF